MKITRPFPPICSLIPLKNTARETVPRQGAPSIARTKGGRLFVGFMSDGITFDTVRPASYR